MFSKSDLINLRAMVNRAGPFQNLEEAQVAVVLAQKLDAAIKQADQAALSRAIDEKLATMHTEKAAQSDGNASAGA